MKKLLFLFIISLGMISCHKEEIKGDLFTDSCVQSFISKNNLQIVSVDKADCIFYSIYQYEGRFYYEFNCCVCDLIPQIVNCDGSLYLEYDWDKIQAFKKKCTVLPYILVVK
ncbi:MAG: hypothetical protein KDC31_04460 [Saprospiraceae bacterium]|jgi:hypothetical protein|nr:hypothetical protein [Saprospiraceae bacterium]MBX7178126.1 hypothetical protein [Saprospiraceae bacterium]MCB0590521.1 hypothetical protein [Saprospiraceae bacterium]MCO5282025.1 hypothetical protein [Saprospiraceae bacterium]MCO6470717.1 hypothetical protein [Saprospiraceae bacterium]